MWIVQNFTTCFSAVKKYSGNVKVTYINYVLPAEAQIRECKIHCGIVWWIYSKWWKKTISEVLFYFLIRDPRGCSCEILIAQHIMLSYTYCEMPLVGNNNIQ